MSKFTKVTAGALVGASLLAAAGAQAGTQTNTMTNIVTVADACDIVAVGVDFGITTLPVPSAGVTSTLANNSTGNAVTGNAGNHPNAGADGGANDTLSLTSPVGAVNTALNTVISAIDVGVPGVYVVCTTTPTSIRLTSGGRSETLSTLATPSTTTFTSNMLGVGGGAGAGNAIYYTLTLTGTPAKSPVAGTTATIFSAAYRATGAIPAAQPGTIVPGYYSDVATAQVDF